MRSLAISLGHNSSAVLIEDGRVLAGYEEERFSAIKSDSRYPINSIEELKARYQLGKDTNVYVGHWFLDAQLPGPNKYWDPQHIRNLFPNGQVESLNSDFSHHDSHLESAMVFAGPNFAQKYTAVVADGFGSFGECISVYQVQGRAYKLLFRAFGFDKSLGMLYQYATAYMGMKMHNHEYKMLAYEVHITEVLDHVDLAILDGLATDAADVYLKQILGRKLSNEFDPVTSLDALPNVQSLINSNLNTVLDTLGFHSIEERDKRIIISYFVQRVVELVMTTIVRMYSSGPLLVAGGLFYNVKLNHLLANMSTKFCAMPLAGDQGAALGVYQAYNGDLEWPDNLTWGDRTLIFNESDLPKGVVLVDNEDQAATIISKSLAKQGWANLVRGRMEYGPRALCNTSTVALPHSSVAADINRANGRTMEMPFAPVVTQEQANRTFLDCGKIHKSLEYMIVTRQYRPGEEAAMIGAAHYYPIENVYTGRPQITADDMMVNLLKANGPLVNTSYNYHGVPIVWSPEQILASHVAQWNTAPELEPTTVIIRG